MSKLTSDLQPRPPFLQSGPPTLTHDLEHGYAVGDTLVDYTNLAAYTCVKNTNGAAVWDSGGVLSEVFPYLVGPAGIAPYQVIQDAISAAVVAGASWATQLDVVIMLGTYTEDLDLYPGANLRAFSIPDEAGWMLVDGAARMPEIIGTHRLKTKPGVDRIKLGGLRFTDDGTNPIFDETAAVAYDIYRCWAESGGAGNVFKSAAGLRVFAKESVLNAYGAGENVFHLGEAGAVNDYFTAYDCYLETAGTYVLQSSGTNIKGIDIVNRGSTVVGGQSRTQSYLSGRIIHNTGATRLTLRVDAIDWEPGGTPHAEIEGTLENNGSGSWFHDTYDSDDDSPFKTPITISGANASQFVEAPKAAAGDLHSYDGIQWKLKNYRIIAPTDDIVAILNGLGNNSFVWLADGTHTVADQINISGKSKITVRGSTASILDITYAGDNPIAITAPSSDITFDGFGVIYNGGAGAQTPLFAPIGAGAAVISRLTVRNIHANFATGAITFVRADGEDIDVHGLTIQNNRLFGASTKGLFRWPMASNRELTQVEIIGNQVDRDTIGGSQGIAFYGAAGSLIEDVTIMGNSIRNIPEQLWFNDSVGTTHKIVINGNTFTFDGSGNSGPEIYGSGISGVLLSNNIFDNTGDERCLLLGDGANFRVSNNAFVNGNKDGLQIASGLTDSIVDGNAVARCGENGIDNQGDNIDVRNNTCRDNTGYGIAEPNATDGCNYFGNRCEDNLAGDYSFHGSSTNRTRLNRHGDQYLQEGLGAKMFTGFPTQADSVMSIDTVPATDEFNIDPAVTSYDFYVNGEKITKSGTDAVAIASDQALHYIWFDGDGVLQVSTSVWDILDAIALVATVYKDGTNYEITDERHYHDRDRSFHRWAHVTIGARYASGLTGTFDNTTLSVVQGVTFDEDLARDTGGTETECALWYRNAGLTAMRIEQAITTPYKVAAGVIQYDNAGTLTNVTNNRYVNSYVYATGDQDYPIAVLVGQAEHPNIAGARNEDFPSILLSTAEWKLLYRVTYRNAAGTPTYIEEEDFRLVSSGPAVDGGSTDHAGLTGRDAANQHPSSAIDKTPAATLTPAGTTQTVDFDNGDSVTVDLGSATGDVTLTLSNPTAGHAYLIQFIQGATFRDVVLPAAVLLPGGSSITTLNITEVDDAVDALVLYYDGTSYLANFTQNYG